MVVDDERLLRTVMRRALTHAGFEVHEAANGALARDLFRIGQFDVVITDVNMPVIGGLELLRHLKLEQPDLPVVLVSGHFEPANGQTALDLGASALLKKPFSIADIQQTALHAVNRRTSATPKLRTWAVHS